MMNLISMTQTITSMEVAEMVEKEHNKLMRDIRRYSEQLGESKIGLTDFWKESSYLSDQNKQLPCYDVTIKGCEFIAHKMTGTKGTVFTARYINRFHDMENALKSQITQSYAELPGMSKTLVPKASTWYAKNRDRIARICEQNNWDTKTLYHKILEHLSHTYNIGAARKIYRKENGYYPPYAIDVVGYFPELAQMADEFLKNLE